MTRTKIVKVFPPEPLIGDCLPPEVKDDKNSDLVINSLKYEAVIKKCQNQINATREWVEKNRDE